MSDQQDPAGSPALDQAYQALGHVGAQLQATQADQAEALRQLEQRERELQQAATEAEASGDQQALTRVQDELDELSRAWRVATEDTEDADA